MELSDSVRDLRVLFRGKKKMKRIKYISYVMGLLLFAACQQQQDAVNLPGGTIRSTQRTNLALLQASDGRLLEVQCVADAASGKRAITSCQDYRGFAKKSTMGTPNANNEIGRGCGCGVTTNNYSNLYPLYRSFYAVYNPIYIPYNTACGSMGLSFNGASSSCSNFYNYLGYAFNPNSLTGLPGYNYNNFSFGTPYNQFSQFWSYYFFR